MYIVNILVMYMFILCVCLCDPCIYGVPPSIRYIVQTVHSRELYNRIVVTFIDKNLPGDTGITVTLNQRMSYSIVRIHSKNSSPVYIHLHVIG